MNVLAATIASYGLFANSPAVQRLGPHPPSSSQVAAMEAQLPSPPDGTRIELRIRFVETNIITRDGPLYQDAGFGMGL